MQLLFRRPLFLEIITEVELMLLSKLMNEAETHQVCSVCAMNRQLLAFGGLLSKAFQKQHEPPRLNVVNCKRSKMSYKNVMAKAK